MNFLIENRLVDVETEEKIVEENYTIYKDDEYGVTSSGIQYPKKW